MNRIRGLVLVSLLISDVSVAAYKCVDAEGNLTFSQAACPTDETSSEVAVDTRGETGKPGSMACELAGLYAEDAAKRMRGGSSFSGEIDRYGGASGAKPGMVPLVNYIFSFANSDAAPGRIAALARTKCESGGLGPVAFENLPVSEYYTWDRQQNAWVRGMAASEAVYQRREEPRPAAPPHAPSADSGVGQSHKHQCERSTSDLSQLESQMRAGYSASEGEALRNRERALKEWISSNCK